MNHMSNKKIVAFAGRKRSGKGMLSVGIKNDFNNAEIVTIADNLKYLCGECIGLSYDELNIAKDDGTTFELKPNEKWYDIIHRETNIDKEHIIKEIGNRTFNNVREILQIIGSDLIRKYVPNWHIDKTIERINSLDDDKIIVVDDVRFPNEKDGIEKIGGEVFFVMRPNCFDVSNHPSEVALKFTDFDTEHIIINDYPKDAMITLFNHFYFSERTDLIPFLLNNKINYYKDALNIFLWKGNDECVTSVLKDIIENVKDDDSFKLYGVIIYKPDNNDKFESANNLFDKYYISHKNFFYIYNPLINEILKSYM